MNSEVNFTDVKKPYPFDLFTPQEKKLAIFFNAKSVVWIAAWTNGNQDPIDEVDATLWGLKPSVMRTIAYRVARHKTGAMPIPELEKLPLPRPDSIHDILIARVKSLDESLQVVEVKTQSCRHLLDESLQVVEVKTQSCRHLLDDIIDRLK